MTYLETEELWCDWCGKDCETIYECWTVDEDENDRLSFVCQECLLLSY